MFAECHIEDVPDSPKLSDHDHSPNAQEQDQQRDEGFT